MIHEPFNVAGLESLKPYSHTPLWGDLTVNPLSPNNVQDQFSPYNYPYTVKR